jgi:hypothetical protein
MMAHAQTMTVSLSLSPWSTAGTANPNAPTFVNGQPTGYKSTEYIAPDSPVPVYVYETITGTSAPSASYVDALQFAYFGVTQNVSSGGIGTITAANLNTNFSGNGAYAGVVGSAGAAGVTTNVVGTGTFTSTSNGSGLAYVRSTPNLMYSTATSDGTNVIVHGKSVSFLVETLTYTPSFTAHNINGSVQTATLNVTVPTLPTGYNPANFLVGLPSASDTVGNAAGLTQAQLAAATYPQVDPVSGLYNAGAVNTYTASTTPITLIDAENGDTTLVGSVTGADFNVVSNNFGTGTKWVTGNMTPGDSAVTGADFNLVSNNFGGTYGPGVATGSGVSADISAQIGGGSASVPEPASLGLLGISALGLLSRRKRI